jgi:hypothetical protein
MADARTWPSCARVPRPQLRAGEGALRRGARVARPGGGAPPPPAARLLPGRTAQERGAGARRCGCGLPGAPGPGGAGLRAPPRVGGCGADAQLGRRHIDKAGPRLAAAQAAVRRHGVTAQSSWSAFEAALPRGDAADVALSGVAVSEAPEPAAAGRPRPRPRCHPGPTCAAGPRAPRGSVHRGAGGGAAAGGTGRGGAARGGGLLSTAARWGPAEGPAGAPGSCRWGAQLPSHPPASSASRVATRSPLAPPCPSARPPRAPRPAPGLHLVLRRRAQAGGRGRALAGAARVAAQVRAGARGHRGQAWACVVCPCTSVPRLAPHLPHP